MSGAKLPKAWVKRLSTTELGKLDWLEGSWKRWIEPTRENRGMVFAMGMLERGEKADWHEHEEPEVFFVLEGRGQARWKINGEVSTARLEPGVAFYKVGGVPHRMLQTGRKPMRGLAFKIARVDAARGADASVRGESHG